MATSCTDDGSKTHMPRYPSTPAVLTCVVTLQLETETGTRPSQPQMVAASATLATAVRSRLFGDGFLPHDVFIDSYDLTID